MFDDIFSPFPRFDKDVKVSSSEIDSEHNCVQVCELENEAMCSNQTSFKQNVYTELDCTNNTSFQCKKDDFHIGNSKDSSFCIQPLEKYESFRVGSCEKDNFHAEPLENDESIEGIKSLHPNLVNDFPKDLLKPLNNSNCSSSTSNLESNKVVSLSKVDLNERSLESLRQNPPYNSFISIEDIGSEHGLEKYFGSSMVNSNVEITGLTESVKSFPYPPEKIVNSHEKNGQIVSGCHTRDLEGNLSKKSYEPYFSECLGVSGDILDDLIFPTSSPNKISGKGTEHVHHTCAHVEYQCFDFANKATALPKSRTAQLNDLTEIDNTPLVNCRCLDCSKCSKCRESPRTKAISMLEILEQQVIEKSVEIDPTENKVYVQLPFMKEPHAHFSDLYARFPRWNGKISNYKQAVKRFLAQTKKPEHIKEGIKKVFEDLLQREYIVKLSDAPPEAIQAVMNSPVCHFYVWDAVLKDESLSTPVRVVVDPTSTGLNQILAKGLNTTGKIEDILIRNRGRKHIFSSDISKMYNVLHLRESAYPYSLILYRDDLCPDSEPEVYLMLRAWYGVRPTGNQAMLAIQLLKDFDTEGEVAAALDALEFDMYVDDLLSGCDTIEEMEQVIEAINRLLAKGGFKLKYVVRSGHKPCEKASNNGHTVKLLGYDWDPETDIISLSECNLNFSPTKRSTKKVKVKVKFETEQELRSHLNEVVLTKRSVLSKIAGFFDPAGYFEPLKLQMKLEFVKLNELDWSEPLNAEQKRTWVEIFSQFFHFSELKINRYFLPKEIDVQTPIRLLCLADAAMLAGGACVYAGVPLPNGQYSCQLVTSKSRLLHGTIPRNELMSIVLLTELVHKVVLSLRCPIGEIVYVTDSSIALQWCRSTSKKLKVFIANRVSTVKTLISWTFENCQLPKTDEVPLFHIDGLLNNADLLTKEEKFSVSTVDYTSIWINGRDWMKLPTSEMPLKSFASIPREHSAEFKSSMLENPHLLDLSNNDSAVVDMYHSQLEPIEIEVDKKAELDRLIPKRMDTNPWIIDILHFGWKKTIRILSRVHFFIRKLQHRVHVKSGKNITDCIFCDNTSLPLAQLELASENYLFAIETKIICQTIPAAKLRSYRLENNILVHDSRLNEENPVICKDVEYDVFFDRTSFNSKTYVVRAESPIFYAYLLFVHLHLAPHSGNVRTERLVLDKVKPIGRFNHIISKVRSSCTTCRLLSSKTVQVKMHDLPREKTVICPPFFNIQADIAYGFVGRPFYKARTNIKLYALVLVCINTNATNILCLENISTQEVTNALLRHSCRYGLPQTIFIDNGSQLISLESAEFSIRDLDLNLWDSKGVHVVVSRPKAHSDRGKVEVRIRLLRELLKKAKFSNFPTLTQLQYETVFAQISNDLNNIPIARSDNSSSKSRLFEIITPNRLLLGRNNFRSLYLNCKLNDSTLPSQILANNSKIFSLYMQCLIDHLHYFTGRPPGKWEVNDERQPIVGDLVSFLFSDNQVNPIWRLGRIVDIKNNRIKIDYYNVTSSTDSRSKFVIRSPRDIKIILGENELSIQSPDYHNKLVNALNLFQSYQRDGCPDLCQRQHDQDKGEACTS